MSNLNAIYNFVQVTENLGTSGQPTAAQFQDIASEGYQILINLAPSDVKGAIPNEGEIVASTGMDYLQIPVIWAKPTLEDWDTFVSALDANKDKKVYIHCQANMRVSAFVMLYRHIKLGIDFEEAHTPMLPIWNPEQENPVWADFIEDVLNKEK